MGNNDKVAPNPPKTNLNINANFDDKKNDYEVTPDTPTNGGKMKQLTMMKTKIMRKGLRRKQIINT